MKKLSDSSARSKRAARNVRHIPDSQIDFSDISELSDEQLASMRRIGRSAERSNKRKRQVATRKLKQLRRRSAMLSGKEIVKAVRRDRTSTGR